MENEATGNFMVHATIRYVAFLYELQHKFSPVRDVWRYFSTMFMATNKGKTVDVQTKDV